MVSTPDPVKVTEVDHGPRGVTGPADFRGEGSRFHGVRHIGFPVGAPDRARQPGHDSARTCVACMTGRRRRSAFRLRNARSRR
jgi:hypothetical protein